MRISLTTPRKDHTPRPRHVDKGRVRVRDNLDIDVFSWSKPEVEAYLTGRLAAYRLVLSRMEQKEPPEKVRQGILGRIQGLLRGVTQQDPIP